MKELFEFGIRCTDCHDSYCMTCLKFECTICRKRCKCKKTNCECKSVKGWIEEKINEAKFLLVSQNTTSNCIDVALNYDFNLHEDVVVNLKVMMRKRFENNIGKKEASIYDSSIRKNFMELSIHINGACHLGRNYVTQQKAGVILPNLNEMKTVAVYCGEERIERHTACLDKLNTLLEKRETILKFTDNVSETLDKTEDPLLVISIIHSRPISDVKSILCGVKEKFYKRVILVLLHFKESDMRSNAPEITEEIKVFDAVDYFQNQDYGNKQKADEAILSALYKYDQSKKSQQVSNLLQ